ncbi:MAG: 6-phosphogluconolactonase [Candidatus Saccharimonadales bacterium]
MEIVHSSNPVSAAADHLARSIKDHLEAGEHVLWLLSGGSGIHVVLAAAKILTDTDLTNLSATLSDERYGKLGHVDENWQQLLDNDLYLPGADLYRPLIGKDRTATSVAFGAWVEQKISTANYTVGLFGIGSDGHTAGIKPHSNAIETTAWAAGYIGDDFERITITPRAISKLDEAIVQASGEDKVPVLKQLLHQDITATEQPAQMLKSIPKCTLYTNNKEL